jgi:nucleotide-binding universal stress UspA family protein
MSYKTLLVHVDEAKNIDTRIGIAAQLAMTEGAHLIGAAMTGVSRFLYDSMAIAPGEPSIMPYLGTMRQRAEDSLNKFENTVQRIGIGSFEKRLVDDDAAGGISLQARYSDLVILGQYDPDGTSSSVYADVPEYVVINSGCPTLIVPYAGSFDNLSDRVLIAWNESIEAARAVRHALPLLQRAKAVDVVVFNSASEPGVFGEQPGTDIAIYLARHNVEVEVHREQTGMDTGNALLSLASNLNSNLLVMGCYGHTRLREILLGGATRTILQSMTIPVLMSH